jgi:branched-chain amino acid transport system substrate-binding protein
MDSTDMSRRRVLGTLGAVGTVGLAGCVGGGDDSGESDADGTVTETETEPKISVGVLQDINGPNGPEFGHQGLSGFLSGLAYKDDSDPASLPDPLTALDGEMLTESVGDVEFTLHVRDTASDAQQAGQHAQQLVNDEEVDILYGLSNSDSLTRVINTVIKSPDVDVPLFVGAASTTEVTTNPDLCRRQVFRASENTGMSCRTGGKYIARETDIERVALFGADYTFGRDVVRNYKEVFEAEGVEVVVDSLVPRGYADWRGELDEAQDGGAQAIIYGFTTPTAAPFFTEFVGANDDQGFLPYDMRVIGDMGGRLALGQLGDRVSELAPGGEITRDLIEAVRFGPLTDRYHWNQYDNGINDWFTETHIDTYGVVPDLLTSGAFTTASAIAQAFEQGGQASKETVLEEVHGMTVEATPKGENEYEFQKYNNQARSPMTMAPVIPKNHEHWPALLQPGERIARVEKEETTIPADSPQMECNLP